MLRVQGLQVQNMVWPPAIISTITAAVNVPVNAVLINWYGFHGAAAATSVTRIFQLIMLVGERPWLHCGLECFLHPRWRGCWRHGVRGSWQSDVTVQSVQCGTEAGQNAACFLRNLRVAGASCQLLGHWCWSSSQWAAEDPAMAAGRPTSFALVH